MADDLNLTALDDTTPSDTGGPTNPDGTPSGDVIQATDITNGVKTPVNVSFLQVQTQFNALNAEVADNTQDITDIVPILEAKTGDDRLSFTALKDTPPNSGVTLNGEPWLLQPETVDVSGGTISFSETVSQADIDEGFVYEVATGGSAFGETVSSGDLILAETDDPSLDTSGTTDWFVISEAATQGLTADQALILSRFSRTGNRVDGDNQLFVNEANVRNNEVITTGLPLQLDYTDSTTDPTQSSSRQQVFDNQGIQTGNFDDAGGSLQISLLVQANSFSGFSPNLTALTINFGSHSFVFTLNVSGTDNTLITPTISVPPGDYSDVGGVSANITLDYQYSGAFFDGSITILDLTFRSTGPLHDAIARIARDEAGDVLNQLDPRILALEAEVATQGGQTAVPRFSERISPLIDVTTVEVAAEEAYFSTTQPTSLNDMTRVDPNHNTFTATATGIFVGVSGKDGHTHVLRNRTSGVEQTLTPAGALGDPNLSVVASFDGIFVYEVSGLVVNDVLEVVISSTATVVKWPYDINNLQDEIAAVREEINNLPLSPLARETIDWLLGIAIAEETSVSLQATARNVELGEDGLTALASVEGQPNQIESGELESEQIKPDGVGDGEIRGRKIAYVPGTQTFPSTGVIVAVDDVGTVTQELIRRNGENYELTQFIPSVPATSRSVARYPAPSTKVAGPDIWQDIPTISFRNGVPVAVADELIFTRNLPPSGRNLTIQYRGVANGNFFGETNVVLAGVGNPSQDAITSFTLDDGGESARVEVQWVAATDRIIVRVTENVHTGLPTISSVQVILSWSETVTTPAQAAGSRQIVIAPYVAGELQPFMFAPSDIRTDVRANGPADTRTLWVATQDGAWDSGYEYNTLFGDLDDGALVIRQPVPGFSNDAIFYNWQGKDLTADLVRSLYVIRDQPRNGLFNAVHSEETTATFSTPLKFPDRINAGAITRDIEEADLREVIVQDESAASTVNIPADSTLALFDGFKTSIVAIGVGAVTLQAPAGVSLNNVPGGGTTVSGWADLTKLSSDEWWVRGDIGSIS